MRTWFALYVQERQEDAVMAAFHSGTLDGLGTWMDMSDRLSTSSFLLALRPCSQQRQRTLK